MLFLLGADLLITERELMNTEVVLVFPILLKHLSQASLLLFNAIAVKGGASVEHRIASKTVQKIY